MMIPSRSCRANGVSLDWSGKMEGLQKNGRSRSQECLSAPGESRTRPWLADVELYGLQWMSGTFLGWVLSYDSGRHCSQECGKVPHKKQAGKAAMQH